MIRQLISHIRLRYLNLLAKASQEELSNHQRLELSLRWFRQSLLKDGGSSAKYSMMFNRWAPAYPETTGFWLSTLIHIQKHYPEIYSHVFLGQQTIDELAEWLLTTQRLDGTFPGSYGDFKNQPARVFNNGQIILGLLDYYEHFKKKDVLDAIISSAEWMVKVQDDDGAWRQFTLHQLSSNTRSAWALLKLGELLNEKKFIHAGTKNIRYALSLQNQNYYFTENGFDVNEIPTTHTIGYALRGILGAGMQFGNEEWIQSVQKAYNKIIPLIKPNGFLAAELDEDWKSDSNFCCLTGNCQLSVIGYLLEQHTGEKQFADAASKLLNYVKNKQLISQSPDVNGGISGSWPVNGAYCAYDIPNWAARFFVDGLLLENQYKKN